jgi:P-type Cu2+ transporter
MAHTAHDHASADQQTPEARHGGHNHGHGEHGGHGDHADMFRRLFWRNLALAVPVLVFSPMIQEWFGYSVGFPGSEWIPVVFGVAIFLDGGRPFLTGGLDEIRSRQPGMMLLIAMAITVAFLASVASVFGWLELEFWWELALLIVIMLLGHWQEMKALGSARSALTALAALLPDEAERVGEDGSVESVPPAELVPGDVVLVRPGARVPADGVISSGQAAFDESMLTGESQPVQHGPGDRVVAGSVATDASVRVEVEAVGEGTALGGIQRLVAEAQESGSRAQALADRAAAALFYVAVGVAVVTAVAWLIFGQPSDALTRTVAVLVIACPHALGLAIPLVISLSTARAAGAGILVRDRLALETMRSVDTVVFDKTGTLTEGSHAVSDLFALDEDADRLLALAAAAESESEHPLARGMRAAAEERGLEVPGADHIETLPGRGVTATVEGREVAVGGPGLIAERDIEVDPDVEQAMTPWRRRGASVLVVAEEGRAIGALALEDRIRPESHPAVRALRERGVDVVMITGDARQVAEHVADNLGIDEVMAEVLPADKDGAIRSLQERGRTVAMVGDGVNDAPALARADVGVAIGAGTDVAIESAGIVLAADDPRMVVPLIDLSRASYRKMVQNLWWAAGYNLVALPLAAGVLAWAGIVLAPAVGAALMSLSTVIVALNAQLLRRLDLRPA